jgi:hypothetical protein
MSITFGVSTKWRATLATAVFAIVVLASHGVAESAVTSGSGSGLTDSEPAAIFCAGNFGTAFADPAVQGRAVVLLTDCDPPEEVCWTANCTQCGCNPGFPDYEICGDDTCISFCTLQCNCEDGDGGEGGGGGGQH